ILVHTTTGCGKQGFPSAQPYLSHTPGANPFCCMFLLVNFFNRPFKWPYRLYVLRSASHMMILHAGTTIDRAMYVLLSYPPCSVSTILLVVKM
ncbi:hypothetical protein BO95DRAFT_507635, partial [Aspergillus brunneoviolaceus CBS 621.78]